MNVSPRFLAAAFKELAPIGTRVRYCPIKGKSAYRLTVVRSEPWVLGSGRVVVAIEGERGGVSINHLEILDHDAKPLLNDKDYVEGPWSCSECGHRSTLMEAIIVLNGEKRDVGGCTMAEIEAWLDEDDDSEDADTYRCPVCGTPGYRNLKKFEPALAVVDGGQT